MLIKFVLSLPYFPARKLDPTRKNTSFDITDSCFKPHQWASPLPRKYIAGEECVIIVDIARTSRDRYRETGEAATAPTSRVHCPGAPCYLYEIGFVRISERTFVGVRRLCAPVKIVPKKARGLHGPPSVVTPPPVVFSVSKLPVFRRNYFFHRKIIHETIRPSCDAYKRTFANRRVGEKKLVSRPSTTTAVTSRAQVPSRSPRAPYARNTPYVQKPADTKNSYNRFAYARIQTHTRTHVVYMYISAVV